MVINIGGHECFLPTTTIVSVCVNGVACVGYNSCIEPPVASERNVLILGVSLWKQPRGRGRRWWRDAAAVGDGGFGFGEVGGKLAFVDIDATTAARGSIVADEALVDAHDAIGEINAAAIVRGRVAVGGCRAAYGGLHAALGCHDVDVTPGHIKAAAVARGCVLTDGGAVEHRRAHFRSLAVVFQRLGIQVDAAALFGFIFFDDHRGDVCVVFAYGEGDVLRDDVVWHDCWVFG